MHVRLGVVGLTLTTGIVLGFGVPAGPAYADQRGGIDAVTFTSFPAGSAINSAAADLAYVRWLSTKDPRQLVRTAARTAIVSSAQDRAVAQFLAVGFDSAKNRAAATKARNLDFAKRVLATTPPAVSPAVYAAAQSAVNGTDADRVRFVATGYAAAKAGDQSARQADGAKARALLRADRDFVSALRDTDPGEQVRVGAAWALRTGATDADVVEFFAYGWLDSASLDLEVHRLRLADSDTAWRATVAQLLIEARTAEASAEAAGQESAEQARAAAARAWQAVGDQTAPARTAWSDAGSVAREQAANWHAVATAALAAAGPNWDPIAGPALANEGEWAGELGTAGEQAEHWNDLLTLALAGERRMTGTAPPLSA